MSGLDGGLRAGNEAGEKTKDELTKLNVYKRDKELIETRSAKAVAVSRLKLIGAEKLASSVFDITKIENDLRQMIIFNKIYPNSEELSDFRNQLREEKGKFYELLQEEFSETYR